MTLRLLLPALLPGGVPECVSACVRRSKREGSDVADSGAADAVVCADRGRTELATRRLSHRAAPAVRFVRGEKVGICLRGCGVAGCKAVVFKDTWNENVYTGHVQ